MERIEIPDYEEVIEFPDNVPVKEMDRFLSGHFPTKKAPGPIRGLSDMAESAMSGRFSDRSNTPQQPTIPDGLLDTATEAVRRALPRMESAAARAVIQATQAGSLVKPNMLSSIVDESAPMQRARELAAERPGMWAGEAGRREERLAEGSPNLLDIGIEGVKRVTGGIESAATDMAARYDLEGKRQHLEDTARMWEDTAQRVSASHRKPPALQGRQFHDEETGKLDWSMVNPLTEEGRLWFADAGASGLTQLAPYAASVVMKAPPAGLAAMGAQEAADVAREAEAVGTSPEDVMTQYLNAAAYVAASEGTFGIGNILRPFAGTRVIGPIAKAMGYAMKAGFETLQEMSEEMIFKLLPILNSMPSDDKQTVMDRIEAGKNAALDVMPEAALMGGGLTAAKAVTDPRAPTTVDDFVKEIEKREQAAGTTEILAETNVKADDMVDALLRGESIVTAPEEVSTDETKPLDDNQQALMNELTALEEAKAAQPKKTKKAKKKGMPVPTQTTMPAPTTEELATQFEIPVIEKKLDDLTTKMIAATGQNKVVLENKLAADIRVEDKRKAKVRKNKKKAGEPMELRDVQLVESTLSTLQSPADDIEVGSGIEDSEPSLQDTRNIIRNLRIDKDISGVERAGVIKALQKAGYNSAHIAVALHEELRSTQETVTTEQPQETTDSIEENPAATALMERTYGKKPTGEQKSILRNRLLQDGYTSEEVQEALGDVPATKQSRLKVDDSGNIDLHAGIDIVSLFKKKREEGKSTIVSGPEVMEEVAQVQRAGAHLQTLRTARSKLQEMAHRIPEEGQTPEQLAQSARINTALETVEEQIGQEEIQLHTADMSTLKQRAKNATAWIPGLLDVETYFNNINMPLVGKAVKLTSGRRDVIQLKTLDTNSNIRTVLTDMNKDSKIPYTEPMLAEDMQRTILLREMAPELVTAMRDGGGSVDIQGLIIKQDDITRLAPAIAELGKFFTDRQTEYGEYGSKVDYMERIKREFKKKKDINIDIDSINAIEDMQFVSLAFLIDYLAPPKKEHSASKWAGELLLDKKTIAARSKRTKIYNNLKLVGTNKRTTFSLYEVLTSKVPVPIEEVTMQSVLGSAGYRYGRDIAALAVIQAAIHDGAAVRKEKGKDAGRPEDYSDGKDVSVALDGYWVHNTLKDTMMHTMESFDEFSSFRKLMAITKMAAFTNPLWVAGNDFRQGAWTGAISPVQAGTSLVHTRGNPLKGNVAKAYDHVYNRTPEYYEALWWGMAAKPFAESFENFQSMFLNDDSGLTIAQKAKNKGLRGLYVGTSAKGVGEIAHGDILKGIQSIAGDNAIKGMYRTSWHTAWQMDKMFRMHTYLYLKSKGHSTENAAQMTAEYHGDYAAVPAGTRRMLNLMFFVPTFKIVMGKLILQSGRDLIKATAHVGKQASDKALGTDFKSEISDMTLQRAVGAIRMIGYVIAMDALMMGMGFRRDEIGRVYSRPEDGPDGRYDLTVNIPTPNVALRWIGKAWTSNTPWHFLQKNRWDVHPLYRVAYGLQQNKNMWGREIYSESDDGYTKALKMTTSAVETIAPFIAVRSMMDMYTGEAGQDKFDSDIDFLFSDLLKPVVNMYRKTPKELVLLRRMQRDRGAVKRDLKRLMREGQDNEEYVERSVERFLETFHRRQADTQKQLDDLNI